MHQVHAKPMDERVESPQTEIRHAPLSRGPAPPVVRRSRSRAWLGLLLVLIVALGGAYWFLYPAPQTTGRPGAGRAAETAPQPVGAETIDNGDIRIILNELGTVTSLANVTVQTQINGQLDRGRLPGRPDGQERRLPGADRPPPIPGRAGTGARARWRTTRRCSAGADRPEALPDAGAPGLRSRSSRRTTSVPGRSSIRARCSPTRRMVDNAKLNLAYCHIVSPVDGRVGLRQVDPGNYVQTSDTNGIVVITQIQPISVMFSVPEDNLPDIMKRLHRRRDSCRCRPTTASNTTLLATGTLSTRRQPDQHHHRHGEAARDLPERRTTLCSPTSSSTRACWWIRCTNVVRVPVAGGAARCAGTLRLRHQSRTTRCRCGRSRWARPMARTPQVHFGPAARRPVVTDGTDRLREGQKVTIPPPHRRAARAAPQAAAHAPAAPTQRPSRRSRQQ